MRSGSGPCSAARQRAQCCSQGLSQESTPLRSSECQQVPHQAEFLLALQTWPLGTCVALCNRQADVAASSRGEQKRRLPKPAGKLCRAENRAMSMTWEIKCLCKSVPRLCAKDVKYRFQASLVEFGEIHRTPLSEKNRLFYLVITWIILLSMKTS